MITLENDALRVAVSCDGAQMQSIFIKRSEREILWQGEPAIWAKRAPWLFPIIGQLRGNYRFGGKEYRIPKHGFASKSRFTVEEHTQSAATFLLEDSPETLDVFPWRFALRIAYRLEGVSLHIRCTVRCKDETDMYFSFGAHPGFFCAPGDMLCFDGAQRLSCQRLDAQTHLLMTQAQEIAEKIDLQEALFDEDAMLVRAPACEGVTLRRADGTGVRFTFGRVPWVGIWSRMRGGLPYVCIEPWYGVDDPMDASGAIEDKLDIQHLEAGKTFCMDLCIAPME